MNDKNYEQRIDLLPPEPPAYPWNVGEEGECSLEGWRWAWVDHKLAYIEYYKIPIQLGRPLLPGEVLPDLQIRTGERIVTRNLHHTTDRATVNDCLRLGIEPCRITASGRGGI